MRILLIYPGARYSVYDVAVGYEGALRELGQEVHAYAYHTAIDYFKLFCGWLRDEYGSKVPNDAPTVFGAERTVIEAIDFAPEVALIVSETGLHRRAYELLHRIGLPLAQIFTECPFSQGRDQRICEVGHVAVAFANDRASVVPLREASGVRVEYLPHSFDPARHFPGEADEDHQTDIFFYGTLWPEREILFEQLDLHGWNARVGGVKLDVGVRKLVGTPIENAEMADWYRGAKIVLNPQRMIEFGGRVMERGEIWSLGPRAFEVAACGAFQICDDSRPELAEVFGDTVATFRDAWDLQWKIGYYLRHDDERRAMAQAAYRRVQGCTFVDRAREIVLPALEEVV